MSELRGNRHYGEQAVQQRLGEGGPDRGSPMFGSTLSDTQRVFIEGQRIAILGGPTSDGSVWVSAVTGERGFIRSLDSHTIAIRTRDALAGPMDRAYGEAELPAASLMVDFETARRLRINGKIRQEEGILTLRSEQVVGNCKKYIHGRVAGHQLANLKPQHFETSHMTLSQCHWIQSADTFFIATHSPEHGADVSHRGGPPGFVTCRDSVLSWPDCKGNSFYMTFGNLEIDKRAGIAFLDWNTGNLLSLSGESWVDWGNTTSTTNERRANFRVDRVVQICSAVSVRWNPMSMFDKTQSPKE